ncbi:MAG TPA: hypothetical protein VNG31_00135 [Candidatus Baltobacteraceae bacterium]|nr:hypothetical protein [Candidatus Baltobacteraceae bacterium]
MYATIRHYRVHGITNAEIADAVHREFLPLITTLPGFVDYHFVDAGDDASISISVFASKEAEAESNAIAAAWVAKRFPDNIERVALHEGPIVAFVRGKHTIV